MLTHQAPRASCFMGFVQKMKPMYNNGFSTYKHNVEESTKIRAVGLLLQSVTCKNLSCQGTVEALR